MGTTLRVLCFLALVASTAAGQDIIYTIDGVASPDRRRVHPIGDVNQDGFADFISTGLAGTLIQSGKNGQILKDLGKAANEAIGLGDANGDGYPDYFQNSPTQRIMSGKDLTVIATFNNDDIKDARPAGDVNNDGFDDLVVGEPYVYTTSAHSGKATVISGNNGVQLYQFNGDGYNDWFGYTVAGVGDVDNDGFADVAASCDSIGAYARIFSGQNGALLHGYTNGMYIDGCAPVGPAGDINQDGFSDFLLGIFGGVQLGAYSGKTGSLIRSFPVPTFYSDVAVDTLGDITGDGKPDVLFGLPDSGFGPLGYGTATGYSGADGSQIFQAVETQAQSNFGQVAFTLGDVNADGINDFAVSAPNFGPSKNKGQGLIYSGKVCGPVVKYAFGCAGTGGFRPKIFLTGCVRAGSNANLFITDGLGGSTAFLLFGLQQASIPMAGGCSLLVQPLFPFAAALPLGGAGPGNGTLFLPITLPATTPAGTLTMQAFVLDNGVPQGYSNSNGLQVTIFN